MKKRGVRRWQIAVLVTSVILALALLLPAWTVCTDYAYVCQNTGSSNGHREWFFGRETGAWYERSALETFMRDKHPDKLEHRWVSYSGTGRDILGNAHSWGHGSGALHAVRHIKGFDTYVNHLADTEKLALHELFSTGDHHTVRTKVDEVWEATLGLDP